MPSTTSLCLLVLLGFAWGSAPPAAAATVVAAEAEQFSASAHGDAVAWSRYLPGPRRYALMISRGGRAPVRARVPLQRDSLTVDLGSNASGRLAAVYSRCPRHAKRCDADVYRYDVAARRERRVTRTANVYEYFPALWRGRIAYLSGTRRTTRLYLRDGRRTRRLSLPSWAHRAGTSGLDLRGGTVATTWWREGRWCDESDEGDKIDPTVYDVIVSRRGEPSENLAHGCDGDGVRDFDSPALTPRGVEFLSDEYRLGAEPSGSRWVPVLRFVDRTGAGLTRRPLDEDVISLAISGERRYAVRHVPGAPPAERWQLVLLDG